MPEYHYKCNSCEFEFLLSHSIHQKLLTDCPNCKEISLSTVIYPVYFFDKTPKTVGSLAEKQRKERGHYGAEAADFKIKQEQEQMRKDRIKALEKSMPKGAKILNKSENAPWYSKYKDYRER